MKTFKTLSILALVVAVGFSLMHQQEVLGQTEVKAYITDLDCSAFPTISLSLRALDSDGNVFTGDINTANFSLYDNDQVVAAPRFVSSEQGPKYVVLSFDLGQFSNLKNFQTEIQQVLNEFANQHFVDGKDTATIVTHTAANSSKVILQPTQSKDDLLQAVAHLDLSSNAGELNGLKGLDDLYSDLAKLDSGRTNTVIIHFSRYIEGVSYTASLEAAKNMGTLLAGKNIKIYVFQTETSGNTSLYDPYKELATRSKGSYLFVPDKPAFQTGYATILRTIDGNSKVYKVQFSSQDFVSDHTISTTISGGNPSSATDKEKCAPVDIQDPTVVFDDPKGGTGLEIRLKPGDPPTQTIKAHVIWNDNKPRDIVKSELLANWEVVDTKTETLSSSDFVLLKLPVQELLGTKSQIHIDLIIRVTDAWDRKGENTITFDLIAPPIPTTTPVPTPIPTKEEAVTRPAPIFVQPATPGCKGKISVKCAKEWVASNWFTTSIIGIVIVLFILLISTRRKIGKLSAPAREALGKRVEQVRDQVRKTLLGGASHQQAAIAYLQVEIARSDRIGAKIELYNNRTTLGRDPSVTDVQLYNPEDKTSVSGLHCTIFYDPGQGKFMITDDNSTNGTYVNNNRLVPNEPTDLNDGDEIILGDVYRQGAKLRFEIPTGSIEATPDVELPPLDEDFNVDLQGDIDQTANELEPPPIRHSEKPRKDFDETVPGYRDDDELNAKDNQPSRFPNPPPKPSPKKGKDKSWLDKLG